jgi:hypothetical protein
MSTLKMTYSNDPVSIATFRTIAVVSNSSIVDLKNLEIAIHATNPASPHLFSANSSSLVKLTDCVIQAPTISVGSVFYQDNGSQLSLELVSMTDGTVFNIASTTTPVRFIHSRGMSNVVFIKSALSNLVISDTTPDNHPSLIDVETGTVQIENTQFTSNTIQCVGPCSLGSLIAIRNVDNYKIESSTFSGTQSPGCNVILVANSPGQFKSNHIENSVITGSPASGISNGQQYPPTTFPSTQAVVCLTRSLANLESDFGVQLGGSKGGPGGNGYMHEVHSNSWANTIYTMGHKLRDFGGKSNDVPLFGADLWASNVAVSLQANNFSASWQGTVRVDACEVQILGVGMVSLGSWIDFGSMVQISATVSTLNVSSLAIYGAAPGSASTYQGMSPILATVQIISSQATPNSIITGGVFSAVKVRMSTVGSTLILGSPFPEDVGLAPSAAKNWPWGYSFAFVNGAQLRSDPNTIVDIVPLVAPLQFTDTSVSYLNGIVRAPRLGSRYSASGANVATIKADQVTLGPSSVLMVVDLCVLGNLQFQGSTLTIEPSFARSTAHGLNVTGTLTGVGLTVSILPFDGHYIGLPYGEASFQGRIPIITAGSVANFPLLFDTEFTISGPNLTFRSEDFVTHGSVKQANLYLSKAEVTAISHANGAAVVARFPSLASSYEDWGIGADCTGFLYPSLNGLHCQWIRKQDLLIWSNGTILPSDVTSLSLGPRYYWATGGTLPKYEQGALELEPLALFRHVPPTIPVDVSFWLDATPSYFLAWRGDEEPTIEWAWAAEVASLLDVHKNDWRFEVPANYLNPGTSYQFSFTIKMSNGVQLAGPPIQTYVTYASVCNPPSVLVDGPAELHYYESMPLNIRVIVDPSCPANVTGPAQFRYIIDSGAPSAWSSEPILTLPPFVRGTKVFDSLGTLAVEANWPILGTTTTLSGIGLRYSSIVPTLQTSHTYELYAMDVDQTVSLDSLPVQSDGGGVLTIDWVDDDMVEGFRCPVPVFEDGLEYPDPAYSPPTTHVRCFNTESVPMSLYELKYTNTTPASLGKILRNLHLWQPGLYSMAVTVKSQQPDNSYRFRKVLPINILPNTAFANTLLRATLFPEGPIVPLALSNGLYPAQMLVLQARAHSGQLCYNCTYQWNVIGVPQSFSGVKTSHLAILPNTFPFGSDIMIEVVMTYPDGYTTSSQISYITHNRPYGGTFTVEPSLNGTFDAHATRWVSEHAGLQYMITEQDCNPPYAHRLVAWPTHSPNWKSLRATIRGCEGHPVLFLHVIDGIGSTTSVSVEMAGYTRVAPPWTSEEMVDLVSSISDNLASGHWDMLLKQLQWMTSIPETMPSAWNAAKQEFVQKIESSEIWERVLVFPQWPMLLHIAFGDSEVLRMLDSAILTAKLMTLPYTPAPVRSELEGYHFASRWQLSNLAFDTRFGPQVSAATRAANVRNWIKSPALINALHSLLQSNAASSGQTTWAVDSSRMWVKTRTVDMLTARTAADWQMVRAGAIGVSLPPSVVSAVSGAHVSIWLQQIVFKQWTHPLMPSNPVVAPFGSAIHFSAKPSFLTSVTASFYFPMATELLNANPQLICAYTTAFAWLPDACTTRKNTSPPGITCECSIPGNTAVSVTVLNPGGFCPQPIPTDSDFICLDGAWILEGNVESPVIVIPPTSVTIIGNLTVDTIQFGGLAGTVNVTGCTKIGTAITIELTLEELETLVASGEMTSLLLTSTGCDISDLKNIPISVTVNGYGRCEKVTVTSETTASTLSGVFKVDTRGCKKKSSRWWIVLVSVLGGVILLGAIFALLATFTPLKHIIRPYAKRAEANTHYNE